MTFFFRKTLTGKLFACTVSNSFLLNRDFFILYKNTIHDNRSQVCLMPLHFSTGTGYFINYYNL